MYQHLVSDVRWWWVARDGVNVIACVIMRISCTFECRIRVFWIVTRTAYAKAKVIIL